MNPLQACIQKGAETVVWSSSRVMRAAQVREPDTPPLRSTGKGSALGAVGAPRPPSLRCTLQATHDAVKLRTLRTSASVFRCSLHFPIGKIRARTHSRSLPVTVKQWCPSLHTTRQHNTSSAAPQPLSNPSLLVETRLVCVLVQFDYNEAGVDLLAFSAVLHCSTVNRAVRAPPF